MMLLHGKNNNLLIPNLSYLGMYQYEAEMRSLQKYEYVFLVGTK